MRSTALDVLADLLGITKHGASFSLGLSTRIRARLESMAIEDKNATLRAQALRTIELFDQVKIGRAADDHVIPMES